MPRLSEEFDGSDDETSVNVLGFNPDGGLVGKAALIVDGTKPNWEWI